MAIAFAVSHPSNEWTLLKVEKTGFDNGGNLLLQRQIRLKVYPNNFTALEN